MSKKFNHIHSTAVPLDNENVDTDQIIPARFLKATSREGFGKNLFRDWRYHDDNEAMPKTDFVLNNPAYSGKILVAGKNFGCGSSREHAAWALKDYGFDAVVSSFFADIFSNNALNNFLLPVRVSDAFLEKLLATVQQHPTAEIAIDLENQTIENTLTGETEHFDINAYKKTCLLNGYDDLDFLLSVREEVTSYELSVTSSQTHTR